MIDFMSVNTETPEQKRDRLLLQWDAAKLAVAAATETEMSLRKECAALLFPDAKEGTNRVELGNGYSAKMVAKKSYKLSSDVDAVDKACDIMAKMGNEGPVITERLIKWKADISVTEYRLLIERADKYKNGDETYATEFRILRELHPILTITDGAPTLEIEEPKVKGKKR